MQFIDISSNTSEYFENVAIAMVSITLTITLTYSFNKLKYMLQCSYATKRGSCLKGPMIPFYVQSRARYFLIYYVFKKNQIPYTHWLTHQFLQNPEAYKLEIRQTYSSQALDAH